MLSCKRRVRMLSMLLLAGCLPAGGFADEEPARAAPEHAVLALENIPEELPFFDGVNHVRPLPAGRVFPPMRAMLSRHRYWAQDGHLDVVVQMESGAVDPAATMVEGVFFDQTGARLSVFQIRPPGPRFIFYPVIPASLAAGGAGVLELNWHSGAEPAPVARLEFRVETSPVKAPPAGRVRLRVANADGIIQPGMPFTVGVPFPRGVLTDIAHLRLIDDRGVRLPLQVMLTARWSKFGSIKWVLCDFTADLAGTAREFFLEYGLPPARSADTGKALVTEDAKHAGGPGFPTVAAGRLRIQDGLWFDPDGGGQPVQVLAEAALAGAFVEPAAGGVYRPAPDTPFVVEESGPVKAVIRRAGWYHLDGQPDAPAFCRYITRYVLHRDSPLLRIWHTWIFTGDGNRDRIRNMGWEFPLAREMTPDGLLTAFGADGVWSRGDYLLQYDHDRYAIVKDGAVREYAGGRAPGAARATGARLGLYLGVKDFWQNFPSELEFRDGALWFHNWPRHNRAASTVYDRELVDDSQWSLSVLQNRFAHEGVSLDFRLPAPVAADKRVIKGGAGVDPNAQGIARTEELWLYLAPADAATPAADFLDAVNGERLRAVVDPAWVADSGAFYEIYQQDKARFPYAESLYELVALAPARWAERLGIYGMWVYGDLPAWVLRLDERRPDIYRAYRKAHHAWPYSWVPFARSGDSRLLKWAEAATRQMIDANHAHHATDDVSTAGIGVWNVGPLPWASGGRPMLHSIHNKCGYMLHAYYLTGCRRAWDNLAVWAREAKGRALSGAQDSLGGGLPYRTPTNLLKTYLEMYEAGFDPWFLVAARAIADGHLHFRRTRQWTGYGVYSGLREYERFAGCPEYRELYLDYAEHWGRERNPEGAGWVRLGMTAIEPNMHAWHLTGDEKYLRRALAYIDPDYTMVYEAQAPDYFQGSHIVGSTATACFTGYYLELFPFVLRGLADVAPERPERLYISALNTQFNVRAGAAPYRYVFPAIHLLKQPGRALPLRLDTHRAAKRREADIRGSHAGYRLSAPDGGVVFEGDWDLADALDLEVPADHPAGVYLLQVATAGHGQLPVPVSPPGVREIYALDPAENNRMWQGGSYWLRLPEGLSRFSVEFRPAYAGRFLMAEIWNPDGRRVWKLHLPPGAQDDPQLLRAVIDVPPEHSGRLWRVVNQAGRGFTMDDAVPALYAVDRDRWFDPDAGNAGADQ